MINSNRERKSSALFHTFGDTGLMRVLILDAHQRSALAVTRSLGCLTDAEVLTADTSTRTLAGSSRWSIASCTYPDPTFQPFEFVDAVSQIVASKGIDIVFPMTDVSTMLLVDKRGRLGNAKLACASEESYEFLTDKAELVKNAQNLGVPVPETVLATRAEDVMHCASQFGYPLVVKPARSRYVAEGRVHATQVRIARSRTEVEAVLRHAVWLEHIPCLVQRFIPGHGAGVFALGNTSEIVAWFSHRRLREKPPAGGVSVLCESASLDPRMKSYAYSLLTSCRWFGPAMVEFRVTPKGEPYLMEVNGRFWGSLQLAIDSGVDFPAILYHLIVGDRRAPSLEYRSGVRLRWLLGDLDNLLIQLRDGTQSNRLKLRAVVSFLASFFDSSCKQEVWRCSDPHPGLYELRKWLGALT